MTADEAKTDPSTLVVVTPVQPAKATNPAVVKKAVALAFVLEYRIKVRTGIEPQRNYRISQHNIHASTAKPVAGMNTIRELLGHHRL